MKVLVLLSAYNGERYIQEQLDSILAQKGVEVSILVRDDGSQDGTCSILKRYVTEHSNVIFKSESNLGFSGSFHRLMRWACESDLSSFDCFAFSDQDDFWEEDKLKIASDVVSRTTGPALYLSNVRLADSVLNPGALGSATPADEVSPVQALIDIYGLGCTFCFNRELLTLCHKLTTVIPPSHDRWLMLIAKWFGTVIYDRDSHMLYRQHGHNVYGDFNPRGMSLLSRVRLMYRRRNEISDHAVILYEALNRPRSRRYLPFYFIEKYRKSFWGRIELIARWNQLGFCRGDWRYNLKKKIKILMGCV